MPNVGNDCIQVEKVMKALFIRKLHLWPRFESNAKTALDAVDKDIQVRSD